MNKSEIQKLLIDHLKENLSSYKENMIKRYVDFVFSRSNDRINSPTEKHHILPKSIYPEYASFINFPWNKVKLSYRDVDKNFASSTDLNKAIGRLFTRLVDNRGFGIVEVNGEPFALVSTIIGSIERARYSIITQSGSSLSAKIFNSGNKRNGYRGYYHDQKFLAPTQAKDTLFEEILKFAETVKGEGEDMFDVIPRLKFTVKEIAVDENRKEKSNDRKESRKGRDSDIESNKKEVVKKYIEDVVKYITSDIEDSIKKLNDSFYSNDIVEDILNGNYRKIEINDTIKEKVADLNSIAFHLKGIYKEGYATSDYWSKDVKLNHYGSKLVELAKKYQDK